MTAATPTTMDFLAWHNILFLSALGVSIVIIIGAALGGLDVGDAHLDLDVHADLDPDFDAHMDAEVDLDHAGGKGLLSFLDLGQIPFTVLLMVSGLIFGLTGVGMSLTFVNVLGKDSPWLGIISVAIALFVMVVLTTRLARLIIKHIPASETYISTKSDLIGSEATMFTNTYADVRRGGDVHRIECRSDSELAPGMKVAVADYDPETKIYTVSPLPQSGS